MPEKKFSIGIDIGGTNTSVGIVDRDGNVFEARKRRTLDYPNAVDFVEAIAADLNPAIQRFGRDQIVGIGIGAPNGNFYSGNIELAANLPWKGTVPLCRMMSEKLHLPTVLTNDANAAALGEMMYGAAKGVNDFIVLTLGTGVGSGIVASGQLLYGHDGFAGEIGHLTVVRDGRLCGCGRKGCLETYASATGIVRTALEFLEETPAHETNPNEPGFLSNRRQTGEEITSESIFSAAQAGDPLAIRLFEFTGTLLGETLANVVAITSPAKIIFFGGLSLSGDYLLGPVKESMERNLLEIYRGKVEVTLSELNEKNAAILGAASLVWKHRQGKESDLVNISG